MADISNNNNSQQDIINNLLVKEEAGNLHYFQDGENKIVQNPLANTSQKNSNDDSDDDSAINAQEVAKKQLDEMVTAPKDDSFSHDINDKSGADEKSELVFHPEDKSQIDRLLESVPIDDSKKYSIEKIVEKLLLKQNLQLDDNYKALFTNLILDFFRNRRSVIATRELLATKIIFEEKTLAVDIVDNILSVIKSLKNKIDNEGGLVVDRKGMKKDMELKVPPIIETKKQEESLENTEANVKGLEESNFAKDLELEKQIDVEKKIVTDNLEDIENKVKETSNTAEIDSQDDSKDVLAPIDFPDKDAELGNVLPTVKFGQEPKGMEEEEPAKDLEIGEENKAEIDESLEEIKSIIPNMTVDPSLDKEVAEEDKLLKELTLDAETIDSANESTIIPQQDLHDVGQLMVEDEEEKKVEDDGAFEIKKIKPEEAIADLSEKTEEALEANKVNKVEPVGTLESIEQTPDEATKLEGTAIDEVKKEFSATPETIASPEKVTEEIIEKPIQKEPVPVTSPLPKVIRPGQTFSIRPKISDVHQVDVRGSGAKHVLTGPVDELASMSLKNFRFLATNAEDRKNKILEKINILEQDSYTKKVAGVKAWRQSPVNKLYLALGSESMTSSKDMTVLISEKEIAGEETLDMEEFSAISDLNKSLRF